MALTSRPPPPAEEVLERGDVQSVHSTALLGAVGQLRACALAHPSGLLASPDPLGALRAAAVAVGALLQRGAAEQQVAAALAALDALLAAIIQEAAASPEGGSGLDLAAPGRCAGALRALVRLVALLPARVAGMDDWMPIIFRQASRAILELRPWRRQSSEDEVTSPESKFPQTELRGLMESLAKLMMRLALPDASVEDDRERERRILAFNMASITARGLMEEWSLAGRPGADALCLR